MSDINLILNHIKKGQIEPVYYLKGDEKYYHDQFIESITGAIFPDKSSRDLNMNIFYGTENSIGDVISAAMSFPMFSDFKLIVVRDFHHLQINDVASFKKYLERPQKSCCLTLSATEQVKKDIDAALQKNSTIVDCPKVKPWRLSKWIQNYCRENNYTIDNYCAGYLAEQTGENLLALEKELQKIYSFKGSDKNITQKDIEQTTGLTNDFNIFALQDAILEKNFQRCLKISRRLLDSGLYIHPIIASLFTFFRKYLLVRLLEKKSDQEILKTAQVREFQLKKYRAHFSNYSADQIRKAIVLLQKFDIDLKSTNLKDFYGLQIFFYKICSR